MSRLIVFGLALLACSQLRAQNTLVAPSPAFATIQSAIQAAHDGDIVEVPPGTYSEALDLLGKSITLRSQAGRDLTIMSAPHQLIRAVSGETRATRVQGFTFRGVHVDQLATIEVKHSGLSIVDCFFDGIVGAPVTAGLIGPAQTISSMHGDLALSNCRFENCRGGNGVYTATSFHPGSPAAALFAQSGKVEIDHCQFINNHAGASGLVSITGNVFPPGVASGGAISMQSVQAVIEDCDFIGNRAGLASYNLVTGATYTPRGGQGGAIAAGGFGSELVLARCRFIDNRSSADPRQPDNPLASGGAVLASGTNLNVSRCLFIGNRASEGGALSTGVLPPGLNSPCRIDGSMFIGNQAALEGGALHVSNCSGGGVSYCDFVANGAAAGAAIKFSGTFGGSFLVGNSIFHESWGSDVTLPSNPAQQTQLFVGNLIGQTGLPGHSNIVGLPGFVDRDSWDFHLSPDSICIDAGQPLAAGPSLDWDGQGRVFDLAPDIGADEFVGLGVAARGSVGDGSGGFADVLTLNGGAGGAARLLELPLGTALLWRLDEIPGSAGMNPFILWGRVGLPAFGESIAVPFAGGELCFVPQPLDYTNLDKFTFADALDFTPWALLPLQGPAPFSFQSAPIFHSVTWTIQGLILDDQGQFRVTNAIGVEVR